MRGRRWVIDFVLARPADPPVASYLANHTIERITGHPARTFAEWAEAHADAFRR